MGSPSRGRRLLLLGVCCGGATSTAAGPPGGRGLATRSAGSSELHAVPSRRMLFPPGCHGIFPAFTGGCQAEDGAPRPPLRLFPADTAQGSGKAEAVQRGAEGGRVSGGHGEGFPRELWECRKRGSSRRRGALPWVRGDAPVRRQLHASRRWRPGRRFLMLPCIAYKETGALWVASRSMRPCHSTHGWLHPIWSLTSTNHSPSRLPPSQRRSAP